jgi:hypothetical protein
MQFRDAASGYRLPLMWLVAGLLQQRPRFNYRPVHFVFVVDRVVLEYIFLRVL